MYSSLIFSRFLNNIKQIHSIDITFCQLFFKYVYECFFDSWENFDKKWIKDYVFMKQLEFWVDTHVENHDNIKIYEWKKIAKMHIVMVK